MGLLWWQLRGFKKPVGPLEVGCNLKRFHWFVTKKCCRRWEQLQEESSWLLKYLMEPDRRRGSKNWGYVWKERCPVWCTVSPQVTAFYLEILCSLCTCSIELRCILRRMPDVNHLFFFNVTWIFHLVFMYLLQCSEPADPNLGLEHICGTALLEGLGGPLSLPFCSQILQWFPTAAVMCSCYWPKVTSAVFHLLPRAFLLLTWTSFLSFFGLLE